MDDFPQYFLHSASGLVGYTQQLTAPMLLAAYQQGIFPWSDHPVAWYAPPQRGILKISNFSPPRNLRRLCHKAQFDITCDAAFTQVMQACAHAHRNSGTWISTRFVDAYSQLFMQGFAHSVEIWQHGMLVGGLYGVQLHGYFSGESMFHTESNASKCALAATIYQLRCLRIAWMDIQVLSAATQALGGENISRRLFGQWLRSVLQKPLQPSQPWPHHIALAAVL